MRKIIPDLLLTFLIACVVIIPFSAFETVAAGSSLQIIFHWPQTVFAIAAIVAARASFFLLLSRRKLEFILPINKWIPSYARRNFAGMITRSNNLTVFSFILIILAFILPLMPFADRRILDVGTLLLTYIMLGWGLSIVVGMVGMLDLGYVAFYAIGAYCYALLNLYFGLGFWLCLPLSGLVAAAIALIIGAPVLRLRGDYFAIVTLGFAEIVRIVLINWQSVTKGANGISNIGRPSFFGIAQLSASPPEDTYAFHQLFGIEFNPMQRIIFTYYIILILALLVCWFVTKLSRLPLGRAFEALRENEIAAQSLGINRHAVRMAAYAFSAAIGGLAGAFFATRQGFVSPESFTIMESIIILAIVVLGGTGHRLGVVFATLILIGLPELFRELEQYRMIAFGAGLVIVMIVRPQGLFANRQPTVILQDTK